MNIGNVKLQNNLLLAPMAGFTDSAFRQIVKRFHCGGVVTEMVSAKALIFQRERTWEMLKIEPIEKPIGVQLFGSDPSLMGKAATILSQTGNYHWIDINMGCPAPKIVKNNEGCALMKNPKLCGEIIEAVVKESIVPVTVKIRKGWDKDSQNGIQIAKIAELAGVSAVTVHGRTREQYYSGKADWEYIGEVTKSISIPVIGNGDVTTPLEARELKKLTQCDGIMVGRGALGKPWIFKEIEEILIGQGVQSPPAIELIKEIVIEHLKLAVADKGEKVALPEMRKHLAWYCKGFPGSAVFRDRINHTKTLEETIKIVEEFFD
jgi:tRNA-dihydrouridine synthase B